MNLYLDDRLLHGRILHGWGSVLRPRRFVLVTERALTAGQAELFRAAAAEVGADCHATCLEPDSELPSSADGDFWLVDALSTALLMKRRGLDFARLVVTGLRESGAGDPGDFDLGPRSAIEIRRLRGEGVAVVLQAFPGAEPRDIDPGAEE